MTLLNTSKTDVSKGLAALADTDKQLFEPATPEELPEPEAEDTPQGALMTPEELKAYNDSDEGRNAVRIVNGWYEDCKNVLSERRRQWRMHEAFERGRQHITYDKTLEKVKDLPRPEGKPRVTVNKMRGIMRTEVAKFTAQQPTATALPDSNSEEDIAAARAAEMLWTSIYNRKNVAARMRGTARWMSVTGLGYMKVYWDGTAWDAPSKLYGDVQVDIVSPYNVFVPDIYIEDINEQPYMIHAYLLPVDQVRYRYGDVLGKDYVPNSDRSAASVEFGRVYETGADSNVKMSLVKEIWVNPNRFEEFEEGAMLILVDNKVVEASITGFPEGYARYPIVRFPHIPTGTYFPACVFDDAISLQREVNRSNSQLVQLKNTMVAGATYYTDGSIDPDKVTTRPGQHIPVLPGYQFPQERKVPDLPPHIAEVMNRTDAQLEDISGQHASTMGRHAPGLEAATAIGTLIEQDEAYISPAIAGVEEGMAEVAKLSVGLFAVYATTERVIKAVGEDQGMDVMLLKGADVAGGTDIRMESASALPQSKSARQALIIDLAKIGAIPPEDVLKLLEVPQIGNYLNQQMETADENAARRENIAFRALAKNPALVEQYYTTWDERVAMGDPSTKSTEPEVDPLTGAPAMDPITGEPVMGTLQAPGIVPVNEWDNHAVHLYILDLLIKGQWFATAPDEVKAEVTKHRKLHVAAQQAQEIQAQVFAAGPTPPPADPGAPPGAGDQPGYVGKNEQQIQEGSTA